MIIKQTLYNMKTISLIKLILYDLVYCICFAIIFFGTLITIGSLIVFGILLYEHGSIEAIEYNLIR
jgi:hypothetical protein